MISPHTRPRVAHSPLQPHSIDRRHHSDVINTLSTPPQPNITDASVSRHGRRRQRSRRRVPVRVLVWLLVVLVVVVVVVGKSMRDKIPYHKTVGGRAPVYCCLLVCLLYLQPSVEAACVRVYAVGRRRRGCCAYDGKVTMMAAEKKGAYCCLRCCCA